MSKKNLKRKRYTAEFKAEAVRLLEGRGDRTVEEVAQSLGVGENMLHAWKRRLDSAGRTHDRGESAEQELQRLRREVTDLKRDRDALVKSIAVFVRDRK
jgi:transposase